MTITATTYGSEPATSLLREKADELERKAAEVRRLCENRAYTAGTNNPSHALEAELLYEPSAAPAESGGTAHRQVVA